MTSIYHWTEDEDDIATDAVMLGISSDSRILTVGGLRFGEAKASIYWAAKGEAVAAAVEGPYPVPVAIERANALCTQYGFNRVVVWLQHRELWSDAWGQLSEAPGIA